MSTTVLTPERRAHLRTALGILIAKGAGMGMRFRPQEADAIARAWGIVRSEKDPQLPFEADGRGPVPSVTTPRSSPLILPDHLAA